MENDARILIVDDTKANLDVLDELLNGEGYTVSLAPNRNIALRIASQAVPDLILLDVMMLGLNGFEVCERLQSDPRTADVPVIFITAEDDPGSVLRGFEVGGLDYIRKPFNDLEVLARVRTHMKIDRLTRELSARNEELQQADATIQAVAIVNLSLWGICPTSSVRRSTRSLGSTGWCFRSRAKASLSSSERIWGRLSTRRTTCSR